MSKGLNQSGFIYITFLLIEAYTNTIGILNILFDKSLIKYHSQLKGIIENKYVTLLVISAYNLLSIDSKLA